MGSGYETIDSGKPSIPLFNPLTTDDAFRHCLTLAACYQLAQSVLKIGSALAERVGQGEVSGWVHCSG